MEPRRLLSAGSPTARSLLRGAKQDAPPGSLVPALTASLGVATLGPSAFAKLAMAIRHAALSKVGVAIVAVAAAASGGGYVVRRTRDVTVRAEVTQPPSATREGEGAGEVVAPQEPRSVGRTVENTLPAPPLATAAPSTSPPSPSPSVEGHVRGREVAAAQPAAAASATASILGELDEIRRVRSLVVAGDGSGALDGLDAYQASHPAGTFEEEALALRVRALRQLGDRAGAEQSLHTLEARYPNSVYAASLEP